MMRTAIKSMDQARALQEARKLFKHSFTPGDAIWRRHIRNGWQTGFTKATIVELLPNGDLRVTDSKTREVLVQGPAWAASDRIGQIL
ncbi:MAG: hypothetical protein KGN32_01505 [Burkholderiales bacterium]|nr:hypothetical protein [Burkholderiales bacterium]